MKIEEFDKIANTFVEAADEIDNLLGRRVWRLSRKIEHVSRLKDQSEISHALFLYLIKIVENRGETQETITKLAEVDKATTAKAVKKLLEKDLVIRIKDIDDKRKYNLYPTEKGIDVYVDMAKKGWEMSSLFFKNFNNDEKEHFKNLLEKMICTLEDEIEILKKED